MKSTMLLGIVLIAIGIAAFGYQGFSYKTREKIVDIGSLHVTAEKTNRVPLPPIVGAVALAGGIALLVVGSRKG